MAAVLTTAQTQAFDNDGFLFPVRVLATDAAEHARTRFLEEQRAARDDPRRDDFLYYKAHVAYRWVDEIVHTATLLDAVGQLLGPDLLLWSCSFVHKGPRTAGRYTWHQDATYWGLVPPHGLTVWLALGDVGAWNGGMRFVRGLHRKGQLVHRNTFAADVLLPRGQEIDGLAETDDAVALALRSGEASLHHVFTPHASGPNTSDGDRVGCAMVFIPTSVRHATVRESAMLVRGADRYGHFAPEPRPTADLDADAVAAHHAAMTSMGTWQAEQALLRERGGAREREGETRP